MDRKALLERVAAGFDNLSISSQSVVESALRSMEQWLAKSIYAEYVPQIKHLIESEKWELLLDSFYQVIQPCSGCCRIQYSFTLNSITTKDKKSSTHWDLQHLIMQLPKKDIQGEIQGGLKSYKIHRYHDWPYLPFIIGLGVCFFMLILFVVLDSILGLHINETLPKLVGMIACGLMLILGKLSIEDLKTDNKIRLIFQTKLFKTMFELDGEDSDKP